MRVRKLCLSCGSRLVGIQRKFCSTECSTRHHNQMRRVQLTCSECGEKFSTAREPNRHLPLCRSCAASIMMLARDWSGSSNPRWRGGQKSWELGRRGSDPDGLSWSVQKRRVWVRDSYTCQDCGKVEHGWRPDVHHIDPWRHSRSHAMDNLVCLCRSCHNKRDKVVECVFGLPVRGGVKGSRAS